MDGRSVHAAGHWALLLLALNGCTDAEDASRSSASSAALARAPANVTLIRSEGPGAWASSPQFVEDLRIGTLDGDERYAFGSIDEMAVGKDGSILIFDGQARHLRLYSPDGTFLKDVGRAGKGPGEYEYVEGMAVTPGGDFAIWDPLTGRITLYSASGDFLETMSSHVAGYWSSVNLHVDQDGNFYVFGVRPLQAAVQTPDGTQLQVEGPGSSERFYLRLSPAGEILDTLWIPVPEAPHQPSFVLMTKEGDHQPFITEMVYDFTPAGGFAYGYTSEYAFEIQTGPGEVSRVERTYDPVPLRVQERAQWEAAVAELNKRGGASAGVQIPDMKPPFRDLDVDDDGRIWIYRYAEAAERQLTTPRPPNAPPAITWRDIPAFDVFEQDGRFLGTALTPRDSRLLVKRGDFVWGVHRGELDESYIVRWRMVVPIRSPLEEG